MAQRKTAVQRKLEAALKTHLARHAVYGDGHREFARVMMALFPEGVVLRTAEDHARWHLMNMLVGKLARYARHYTNGGHQDSLHDLGVYAFLLEAEDEHQHQHATRHPRHRR